MDALWGAPPESSYGVNAILAKETCDPAPSAETVAEAPFPVTPLLTAMLPELVTDPALTAVCAIGPIVGLAIFAPLFTPVWDTAATAPAADIANEAAVPPSVPVPMVPPLFTMVPSAVFVEVWVILEIEALEPNPVLRIFVTATDETAPVALELTLEASALWFTFITIPLFVFVTSEALVEVCVTLPIGGPLACVVLNVAETAVAAPVAETENVFPLPWESPISTIPPVLEIAPRLLSLVWVMFPTLIDDVVAPLSFEIEKADTAPVVPTDMLAVPIALPPRSINTAGGRDAARVGSGLIDIAETASRPDEVCDNCNRADSRGGARSANA